jgi:hypothetical protein
MLCLIGSSKCHQDHIIGDIITLYLLALRLVYIDYSLLTLVFNNKTLKRVIIGIK